MGRISIKKTTSIIVKYLNSTAISAVIKYIFYSIFYDDDFLFVLRLVPNWDSVINLEETIMRNKRNAIHKVPKERQSARTLKEETLMNGKWHSPGRLC